MRKVKVFSALVALLVVFVFSGCNGGGPAEVGIAPEFLSEIVSGGAIGNSAVENIPSYAKFMQVINMPLITGMTNKPVADSYSDTIAGKRVNVVRTIADDGTITFEATGDNIAVIVVYNPNQNEFSYKQVLKATISLAPIDYYVVASSNCIAFDEVSDSWEGDVNTYVLMDHSRNPSVGDVDGVPYSMSNYQSYYYSDDKVTGICIHSGRGGGSKIEAEAIIASVESIDDADTIIAYWNANSGSVTPGGIAQIAYYNGSYDLYVSETDEDLIAKAKELSPNWDLSGKF